jgi:hypothetical protein
MSISMSLLPHWASHDAIGPVALTNDFCIEAEA